MLEGYCLSSRQRVNILKSAIHFSLKTPIHLWRLIWDILGIAEYDGALRYPGVSVSGGRLSKVKCARMVQMVQERVEGLQSRALSSMDRIILIRSVLTSFSVYMLSNIVIPKSVILKVEQIICTFLWGSAYTGLGVHFLGWHVVCQPIRDGGFGIHSLVVRREALLVRHVARLLLYPCSMCTSMMKARYGTPAFSERRIQAGQHCSAIWREMAARASDILHQMRWVMGDSMLINFMTDS